MMLIEMTNSLHNTTAKVRVPENGKLTARQVKRCRSKLCGMTDCKCASDSLGRYGNQPIFTIDEEPVEVRFMETYDGGGYIEFNSLR